MCAWQEEKSYCLLFLTSLINDNNIFLTRLRGKLGDGMIYENALDYVFINVI